MAPLAEERKRFLGRRGRTCIVTLEQCDVAEIPDGPRSVLPRTTPNDNRLFEEFGRSSVLFGKHRRFAKFMERPCDSRGIAECASKVERLDGVRGGAIDVTEVSHKIGRAEEDVDPQIRRRLRMPRKSCGDVLRSLPQVPAQNPEVSERPHKWKLVRSTDIREIAQGGTEVVVFALEDVVFLTELLCQTKKVSGVLQAHRVRGSLRELAGVLPDRFQHPVALIRETKETLFDKRLQGVEVGVSDFLCGFERAAAGEDGEGPKEALLLLGEEVVAPLDRRSQRLLPGVCVAAALEQVEPLREPLQDLLGREHLRAGGRELDREREQVETAAELGDLLARFELGALAEERDSLRFLQRWDLVLDLALHAQELAARAEEGEARAP